MTLALHTQPASPTPMELLLHLLERIDDWADPSGVSGVVADVLRERLAHPTVTVLRHEAGADTVQVLAVSPAGAGAAAVGARLPLGSGILARAIREGAAQRTSSAYVEPDFVRSMPGDTRSELVVPVLRGGVVRGALRLEYASPHRPGPDAEALAELFTQPLAVALGIAAARPAGGGGDAAAELRLRQARIVAGISDLLARSDGVDEVLQRTAAGALELVPAECALLLLRHSERQMLEVAAAAGEPLLAPGDLVPLEGTLAGSLLAQPRPLSARLGGAERLTADDAERGLRDVLLVPLAAGGRTFGALALLNHPAGAPSADEVELVQGLAQLASPVEALRQLKPLQQRISDASLLAEVGRAMTGTLGREEVLALVLQAAQMLVNANCAAVGLVSEVGDSITLVSTSGVLRRSQGLSIPLHGSLMGWSVVHGEALIAESISDDPRSFSIDVRQGPGVVVPLESRGQILGALLAGRREGAPQPSDEDVDALRKLGTHAAIAIDNARLYEEQTELSRALRAQAAELEHAYAELRSSQDRLVVSEKMAALGRVTAGIAHEINSPLGSILNCLQLSLGYAHEYRASVTDPDVTPEDHLAIAVDLVESLELAEGAARRVAQFVRSIKSQTRMHEEEARAFDPVAEVQSTVVLLQHELRNRNVTVHVEAEPELTLSGDPGKFAVIVQNLLSNAIDAYGGEPGEVWARLRADERGTVLEVEDRGCGIPEEILPRIYDYLFTTKDIGQGTGLGLSMVHSSVTTHFKGDIEVRSEVGVGTSFIITFPASAKTV